MIVVAAVCLAVAVALAVALVRTRRRVADLDAAVAVQAEERNAARMEAASAHDRAAAARRERDDAFERVRRARRDAAEVAGRLRDESTARADAEAAAAEEAARAAELAREVADARAAVAECTATLDDLRSRGAAASEPGELEVLWELALARAERTWRTSISLSVDDECPLASSDHRLRTAVEIEIDAAREEAGADVDLCWTGEASVPPATAVVVFGLVESAIAEVSKSAERTTVHVAVGDDQVELRVEAVDDTGRALALRWPSVVSEAPGEARVPVARASAERRD